MVKDENYCDTLHVWCVNMFVQDKIACDFFMFVDPKYTTQSMEVINQLVKEHIDTRDWVPRDRNEQY